jgi:putative molybdopterin biosynthesis protein
MFVSSAAPHLKLRGAASQEQFLEVIDREEATRRFQSALNMAPLPPREIALAEALGRVLAMDVVSTVDVPGFDRANVDGFAVQAADTAGASENAPVHLVLNEEVLSPGKVATTAVASGTATVIATGGMIPRGADAVLMVEYTDVVEREGRTMIEVRRAVAPGQYISFAGMDVAKGETVLRAGQHLSSREIGVLAAIGRSSVMVHGRPRVAIISTGDEIVSPGEAIRPGGVYDSNGAILAAAVRELGGEPWPMGVVPDDDGRLQQILDEALCFDMVILSGGTSKGAGDLSYRAVSRLKEPGIVAHGVALKPGKPICLAVAEHTPVVILPGFPTSAIFTFHEFVAPVLRAFAGQPPAARATLRARLPMRVNSERGRTEFLLVSLVRGDEELVAYPTGKSSGTVTAFSFADGFTVIDQQTEMLDADAEVEIQLIGELEPADLVAVGSHCVGLDYLLGELQRRGISVKSLHVGSMGGLSAARRGECDLGGIHLMDPNTGQYNRPLLTEELDLIPGYGRMQGIVFRKGDARFEGRAPREAVHGAAADAACTMINRNAGSGTRILIDQLLEGAQPPGYAVQAKSHNAVATAVAQGRADWGMAIMTVANDYGLGFIALQEERYDFVVPKKRMERPAVRAFRALLEDEQVRSHLAGIGFLI